MVRNYYISLSFGTFITFYICHNSVTSLAERKIYHLDESSRSLENFARSWTLQSGVDLCCFSFFWFCLPLLWERKIVWHLCVREPECAGKWSVSCAQVPFATLHSAGEYCNDHRAKADGARISSSQTPPYCSFQIRD